MTEREISFEGKMHIHYAMVEANRVGTKENLLRSLIGLAKIYGPSTFQDAEMALRVNGSNIYLIAVPIEKAKDDAYFARPLNWPEVEEERFVLQVCMEGKEAAFERLKDVGILYRENYMNLGKVDFLEVNEIISEKDRRKAKWRWN